jgi:hypothetical protein
VPGGGNKVQDGVDARVKELGAALHARLLGQEGAELVQHVRQHRVHSGVRRPPPHPDNHTRSGGQAQPPQTRRYTSDYNTEKVCVREW